MSLKRFAVLSSSLCLAFVGGVLFAQERYIQDRTIAVTELDSSEVAALSPDSSVDPELAAAAANWTHVGCIQLNQDCYDVFQDTNGVLWVCKACGTTRNPGPGKCRKLTPFEIANSLWCS